MSSDSTNFTQEHIDRVYELIHEVRENLHQRACDHDASKLVEPEKEMFDRMSDKLPGLKYGSTEYAAARKEMLDQALGHHYAHNDHHPEHFKGGVQDMNLLQLIEMLADWKAAGERHLDSKGLRHSIEINAERFGYDEGFARTLILTAEELGWL